MRQVVHQVGWFVIVGAAASLTHWLVVVAIVAGFSAQPLIANIAGWLVAFTVSFSGHYHLTFRYQKASLRSAVTRFFIVSAIGFAINEASYAWLLHATALPYDVLLFLVLVGVAALTFVLSRLWAFRPAAS